MQYEAVLWEKQQKSKRGWIEADRDGKKTLWCQGLKIYRV